jgi:hypothetical protein
LSESSLEIEINLSLPVRQQVPCREAMAFSFNHLQKWLGALESAGVRKFDALAEAPSHRRFEAGALADGEEGSSIETLLILEGVEFPYSSPKSSGWQRGRPIISL